MINCEIYPEKQLIIFLRGSNLPWPTTRATSTIGKQPTNDHEMGAIDFYPNSKLRLQSMFLHRKSTNLISKAKEVALVAHPHIMPSPTIRSSAANLTRTMAAINKDGIGVDPHELDAIFEQKRSLRSKVRKALKNMDPILRSQEGRYIN